MSTRFIFLRLRQVFGYHRLVPFPRGYFFSRDWGFPIVVGYRCLDRYATFLRVCRAVLQL